MQENIPDLAKIAERAAVKQQIKEQAAEAAAIEQVGRWDREMTRAFKGILAAPTRRAMLVRAAERERS